MSLWTLVSVIWPPSFFWHMSYRVLHKSANKIIPGLFCKKLDILGLSKIIQAFKVYLLGFCWIRKTGFGIELPNFDWKIIQAQNAWIILDFCLD